MNKTIEFIWKVWLRPNLLATATDNNYVAEVSTTGKTSRNADLAQAIVNEGSEIKYDTLLSILNQRDRIVRQKIQEGGSVLDGVSHIQPRITGIWKGANATFNAATHRVTVDMSPSAELREALTVVGAEVLGIKESGAYIGLVTDTATGKTDGTVTANDDIIITGRKIKVAPEGDDSLGVFIHNTSTGETFRISRRLIQNSPKKLIARLPDIPAGNYTLTVVTRYSQGHSVFLNELRTIIYEHPLTVIPASTSTA